MIVFDDKLLWCDAVKTFIFVLSYSLLHDKYFLQNLYLAKRKILQIFSMLPKFKKHILKTLINKCL